MNKLTFALLVVLTTALMGSSFAIGKMAMVYATPVLLVSFRFTIAGLIMAIIVTVLKRPYPKKLTHWLHIFMIGTFQTAGVMGCIFLSLRTITAGESSILTFMNPLLVVVFGTLFARKRYGLGQWMGVMLGFIGVFITLGFHLTIQVGTLLGFSSAVSWAIATLLIQKWGRNLDVWVLTAYQMLTGGILLFSSSFLLESPKFIVTIESLFLLLWLAIMASIVQFAGWFFLLQKGDAGKTSAFLFLAPFFGVLSGWLLLGEQPHLYVLFGGMLILVGIFLVNWTSSTAVHKKGMVKKDSA